MKSYWQLLKVILRHKWYVFIAGRRLRVPFWRLVVHDMSKFSWAEFEPYARNFYGDKDDPAGFNRAWVHHQNCNAHHWEHWIDRSNNKPQVMPEIVVREMVADWFAAGKAYNGTWPNPFHYTWLWDNTTRMHLHPQTWSRVLVVLDESGKYTW
jgi:hypothetical protein